MTQLAQLKRRWYRLELKATRLLDALGLTENQKIVALTLLIGAACGLAAVLFHVGLDVAQRQLIQRAEELPSRWRIFWMLVTPTVGGSLAGLLLQSVKDAAGSGIPQVKTAYHLNYGRIPFKVVMAKWGLGTLCIGSGLSLGREGPTVQICAGLASLLGRLTAVSRRTLMNLIPVGSAAGLAAAFNTPIAAVTFTLEEVIGDLSHKSIGIIVVASVIASVIERSILGPLPLFTVPPYHLNQARELLFYALLGVLAAGASVVFNVGLLRLRQWFLDWKIPAWLKPGVGGFVVGLIGLTALYGVGAQDLVKNLIGGLVILVDRPYQLGDRVKIGDAYGEIDHIGLRSTKLTTPDDTRVTIPNSDILDGKAWNANSGVPDCQVVTDLYLPPDTDPVEALEIGYEAAYSSPYLLLVKPVVVLLQDGFEYRPFLRVRVKAYVYDHRFEPRLQSDITLRAKAEFLKRGMLKRWSRYDDVAPTAVLRAGRKVQEESGPSAGPA